MRISDLFTGAAALLAGLAGAISAGASDAPRPGIMPPGTYNVAPHLAAGNTVLWGGDLAGTSAPPEAWAPVDPGETLYCRRTCSISANMMVTLWSKYTYTRYAVCFFLDDSVQNCGYAGTAVEANMDIGVSQLSFGVGLPAGTHKVQTKIYADGTVYLGVYNLRYDIVK
jgi:hypothetical protein